jgi:hypothetical protein
VSVSPDSAGARFGGALSLGGLRGSEPVAKGREHHVKVELDAGDLGVDSIEEARHRGGMRDQRGNDHANMMMDSAAGVKRPTDKSVDGNRGPC